MKGNYTKTISYLRSTHQNSKVTDGDDILLKKQSENAEISNIELLLEDQIHKYNRLKSQKQKEAMFLYDEETKKVKLLEKLKERQDKIAQIKEKKKNEKVI